MVVPIIIVNYEMLNKPEILPFNMQPTDTSKSCFDFICQSADIVTLSLYEAVVESPHSDFALNVQTHDT